MRPGSIAATARCNGVLPANARQAAQGVGKNPGDFAPLGINKIDAFGYLSKQLYWPS
jgi:hypothetical protein